MTDERVIGRIEEVLVEITRLGGQNERTSIVSNLVVVDAAPVGLTGFITIADERDGDTILAKTVPGIIYAASDKVNVLFVEGTEPIAFQQGSESPSSGLWGIVPSTSTDIFYNGGDVGIGKSVAPDASLEILDTAQAQLRLTHTEDSKFVDLTLDTNHDLTITPSSTGQVIFQPTTDSVDFFQVLDADGGTPILNVDSVNERLGIATTGPDAKLDILATTAQLRLTHTDGSKFADFTLDTNHDLTITPSSTGQIILQPTTDSIDFFQVLDANGGTPTLNVDSTNEAVSILTTTTNYTHQGGSTQVALLVQSPNAIRRRALALSRISDSAGRGAQNAFLRARVGPAAVADGDTVGLFNFESHDGTDYNASAQFLGEIDGAVSANTVPTAFIIKTSPDQQGGLVDRFHITSGGLIGIGNVTSPSAQLHIDQADSSPTTPIPVLLLDQADVDEPFTKYIGSAAAATLTRSIVAEADVTTATRQGFTKIEIDDVGNQVTDQDYFVAFYTLA